MGSNASSTKNSILWGHNALTMNNGEKEELSLSSRSHLPQVQTGKDTQHLDSNPKSTMQEPSIKQNVSRDITEHTTDRKVLSMIFFEHIT